MKKLLLGLTAFLLAANAWAEKFEYDGIYYEILDEDNNLLRVLFDESYKDESFTTAIIPSTFTDGKKYTVTEINYGAFKECTHLTSVTIPATITNIYSSAFYGCTSLSSVVIPSSVKSIGGNAFSRCTNLKTVTINEGLESIDYSAFYGCTSLESITFPSTIKNIGNNAFGECTNLSSVTFPDNIETLSFGANVFNGCSYSPEYTIENGCKYMKIVGNEHFVLIDGPYNAESVNINSNCKAIGGQAFMWNRRVTSIYIPEGVTSIGDEAFKYCNNLASVTIPSTVKSIGVSAFEGCESLISAAIPEGVTSINNNVFACCSNLASVTIPSTVTHFGYEAFAQCSNLTSIKIPEGATVGYDVFGSCENLTMVTLPSNCEFEYGYEFYYAQLVLCDAANKEACSWRNNLTFDENCKFVWNYKNKTVTADAAEVEGVKYGSVTADHNDFVYAYGDTAILTATPNTDCKFVGWSDGNHDNPRKVVVLDNEVDATVNTYTAAFYTNTAETYEILAAPNNTATNLRGTVSGDGVYLKNASVTLTATSVNDDFYHFVGWSNGTEIVEDEATYSFTATANVSLTAIFEGQTVNIGDNTVKAVGRNTDNCTFHPTLTGRYTITSTFGDGTNAYGYLLDNEGYILAEKFSGGERDNFKIAYNLEAGKTYHIGAGFSDINRSGEVPLNISTPDMVIRTAANGNGVVDGAGYFPYNQPATVTANPNPGYHFVKWQDGETENPRNFTVTESTTFTALFEINTYTIAIANAENGTTSGAGTYTHGQSVTLTASAAEGYHFVGWGDGNSETTRTFSASEDMNLTPTFAINQYTVSVEFENGSVTGTGTYTHGQTAHLVASASEGFEFAGWSDDCGTAERDTVVTSNVALRAIFINQGDHLYNIKVATPENGTIAGDGKYIVGATATLHAYAAEGYHFVGWGDGNTDTLRTFTVTADMQLTPSFAINQYTVAVSKADNGTVTGAATYNHGDAVKVVATANTGYHFIGWSTGEMSDTLKFTATRDTAFTPSFEINIYKVTAVAEKGSVAGAHTYTHGSDATLTAYPEDGYHFVKWADGVESATRTLVVLKDTAFTALFEINMYTASVAESAHGSVSGAGSYTHGQTATFAATADAGYEFLFWSDGSKVNPRIVKMTKDVEMRAVFSLEGHSAFNVTVGSGAHGTVTGGGLYIEGETATLTAKPESAAYHFVAWSDNNTQNPRNVVVDKEISLVATFAINTYTVKAATHENETERGSVTGGGTYNYGDMATLRATPAEGFRFTGWSDGDVYNIKYLNITKDEAFTAHFAPAVGTDTLYVDKIIEKVVTDTLYVDKIIEKIVEKIVTDTIKIDRIIKDTVRIEGSGEDTVYIHENVYLKDTIYITKTDTIFITKTDTVYITKTDTVYIEKETGKPTAINAAAATAVNIYAHHNIIVVENAEDEIRVYDAMGRLVCREAVNRDRAELRVNGTGIYIVKTGNTAKRVMIND